MAELVPQLRRELSLNLVIANGENAAGGIGLTPETAQELLAAGVDVLTSGNHVWQYKELLPYLDSALPILRTLNYPPQVAGKGFISKNGALIINLLGRTFMGSCDCPFRTVDKLLTEMNNLPQVILVDFHAEATSEKMALGWYLNGRVGAVVGTHTHVATADCRLLPKGTAYVTDVGMVGPMDSVIGIDPKAALSRFLTNIPHTLPVGKGRTIFNSVFIEVDDASGKAQSIMRLDKELE